MKVIYKKDILRPVRITLPAEGEEWELTTVTEVFEGETVELEGQTYVVGSAAIGEYYGARIYRLKLLRTVVSGGDPAVES
ncbi:MAG: hypothetical protein EOP86_00915 [Verrucomicrobiaceae bacterium]|nr:MAG: hypothetical protein EOP86_00915 [Verrucomicrobiaceae bacterium]